MDPKQYLYETKHSEPSPASTGDCLMAFLNKHWKPGLKQVFDWHLIPCYKKYDIYILICQVGNFKLYDALHYKQAVVYINILNLPKQLLDVSCRYEDQIIPFKTGIYSSAAGSNVNNVIRNMFDIYDRKDQEQYDNVRACYNVVELKRQNRSHLETAVYMLRGQLQYNLYHCPKSSIPVYNMCFRILMLQSYAMPAMDQENITNPEIVALVNMLQHHHVCHVYVLNGSDKHSYVTHHPWCRVNLSAVVNMDQSHHVSSGDVCGPWQVMYDDSHCMSDWVAGEGLLQCTNDTVQDGLFMAHVFKCDRLSIPWYRVCDSVTDCSDMSDEILCSQELTTKPLMLPNKDTIDTDMEPTKHKENSDNKDRIIPDAGFNCNYTGQILPFDLVEDFLPDCYSSILTEESIISDENLLSPPFYSEKPTNMIFDGFPCLLGHPLHFPFHVICHYDLNKHGRLRYCGNGAHLSGCTDHGCSNMFKCPGSYCVAVIRVCDDFVDCPGGEDESDCSSHTPSCPELYKCYVRGCIHPTEVCDNKVDCPIYGEDEMFCHLAPCPKRCSCGYNSMVCTNASLTSVELTQYKHVQITNSQGGLPSLTSGTQVVILNISMNGLGRTENGMFDSVQNVAVIDLKKNKLLIIKAMSFRRLYNLRQVLLAGNRIRVIEPKAFHNLPKVETLNISYSDLQVIRSDIIHTLPMIEIFDCSGCNIKLLDLGFVKPSVKRLALLNASIEKLHGEINTSLVFNLDTNISYLCCMFPNAICLAYPPPPCLCSKHFPENTFRMEVICPLLVTLVTLVAITIRIWKRVVIERAQIAVNILGVLFNTSILMAASQGFIFKQFEIHPPWGQEAYVLYDNQCPAVPGCNCCLSPVHSGSLLYLYDFFAPQWNLYYT